MCLTFKISNADNYPSRAFAESFIVTATKSNLLWQKKEPNKEANKQTVIIHWEADCTLGDCATEACCKQSSESKKTYVLFVCLQS